MGILDFFSGGVVESVGKVADGLFTSDEERLEKEIEMQKTKSVYSLEDKKQEFGLVRDEMAQTTSRWVSDNQGNFLTKSVRPLTLIYLIVIISALAILDGNQLIENFNIKSSWVSLFEGLTMLVFGAFFGGKTIERLKKVG